MSAKEAVTRLQAGASCSRCCCHHVNCTACFHSHFPSASYPGPSGTARVPRHVQNLRARAQSPHLILATSGMQGQRTHPRRFTGTGRCIWKLHVLFLHISCVSLKRFATAFSDNHYPAQQGPSLLKLTVSRTQVSRSRIRKTVMCIPVPPLCTSEGVQRLPETKIWEWGQVPTLPPFALL